MNGFDLLIMVVQITTSRQDILSTASRSLGRVFELQYVTTCPKHVSQRFIISRSHLTWMKYSCIVAQLLYKCCMKWEKI